MRIAPRSVVADIVAARIDPINAFGILQRFPSGATVMEDLKQKVVRGGFVKLCAQAANVLIRVASLAILARLLDPTDFGLVAMVTAVTGLLKLFRDFGLSTATIQQKDITEGQISTLFWINLLIGGMLAASAAAGAPDIAAFYHEPRLVWITVALAGSFIFNAAGVQHAALLRREMRFTTLALIHIASLTISTATGIAMAFAGLGYWGSGRNGCGAAWRLQRVRLAGRRVGAGMAAAARPYSFHAWVRWHNHAERYRGLCRL
jgi:hypothetical protein